MASPDHHLNLLAAFIEGRVDEHERQRVVAHLATCADCRTVLAQLTREQMPAGLAARSTPVRRAWSAPVRVWLPIAASVVLTVLGAFYFLRPAGDEPAYTDEQLLARRSASRTIAGKTFRMQEGAWVDAGFDPAASLPTVIVRGAQERANLLAGMPGLAPYAQLGTRVVVVSKGTVYRFEP